MPTFTAHDPDPVSDVCRQCGMTGLQQLMNTGLSCDDWKRRAATGVAPPATLLQGVYNPATLFQGVYKATPIPADGGLSDLISDADRVDPNPPMPAAAIDLMEKRIDTAIKAQQRLAETELKPGESLTEDCACGEPRSAHFKYREFCTRATCGCSEFTKPEPKAKPKACYICGRPAHATGLCPYFPHKPSTHRYEP